MMNNENNKNNLFKNFDEVPQGIITLRANKAEFVVFENTPSISKSVSVSYQQKAYPQLPTSINYFESSQARTYEVSGIKFVSRTEEEAKRNIQYVRLLESWTKNYFGNGTDRNMIGMPPPVLLFRAHGNLKDDKITGIYDIPVVITSFSVDYSNEVDYLILPDGTKQPIIQTCSLSLLETHTPAAISKFNPEKFKNGSLLNW